MDPHEPTQTGMTPLNAAVTRRSKRTMQYLGGLRAKERSDAIRQSLDSAHQSFRRNVLETTKTARANAIQPDGYAPGERALNTYKKRRPRSVLLVVWFQPCATLLKTMPVIFFMLKLVITRYGPGGNRLKSKAAINAEKVEVARLRMEAAERVKRAAEQEAKLRGRLKLTSVCQKSLFR
jgi:hypothetical protein